MTAFGEACFKGNLKAAEWLVVHGCGPDVRAPNNLGTGSTPTLLACLGGQMDVAEWLHDAVGAEADVGVANHGGMTPLHAAAMGGHPAICA